MPMLMAFASALTSDLNGSAHYLVWGFVQVSIGNLVVILIMVLLFVLALVLPFPKGKDES